MYILGIGQIDGDVGKAIGRGACDPLLRFDVQMSLKDVIRVSWSLKQSNDLTGWKT